MAKFSANDGDPDANDEITVNGVLINPAGPKISIGTFTTKEGGSLIMYSDGTYLYTPPAGI
jgi:hypothetical protein